MATDIWLSILLPVYNVEPYLVECVHSILEQVVDDDGVQIIMLDDASTDGSRAIAEELHSQHPHFIKLLHHHVNQGLSAARNHLLDAAEGEHIWFVDSDDYLLEGALKELRAVVKKHDPDLILCDYRRTRFIRKRSFYGPTRKLSSDIGELVTGVFKSRKMYSWIKISRRSLWHDGLRFPAGKIFEDIATTPWLLLNARHYYYVPSAWMFYRRRAGSIMDNFKRKPDIFDERRNRDLGEALAGFKEDLNRRLPGSNPASDYYISDFCAKQFVKVAFRFTRAQRSVNSSVLRLTDILGVFEHAAPIRFEQLLPEFLKRGRLVRYMLLKYVLCRVRTSEK